jgi:hypothetical protein
MLFFACPLVGLEVGSQVTATGALSVAPWALGLALLLVGLVWIARASKRVMGLEQTS